MRQGTCHLQHEKMPSPMRSITKDSRQGATAVPMSMEFDAANSSQEEEDSTPQRAQDDTACTGRLCSPFPGSKNDMSVQGKN